MSNFIKIKESIKGWCLIIVVISLSCNDKVYAQNNACGSQHIELVLGGVIDIGFHETGNNNINFSFNNAQELVNGQYSNPQVMHVCSDRNFKVGVKMNVVEGIAFNGNIIDITQISFPLFGLKIIENNTHGYLVSPFNTSTYNPLLKEEQNLIVNGMNGFDQTFSLIYKCIPGFQIKSGNYTIVITYTATQE